MQNYYGHNVARILVDNLEAVQQILPQCATVVEKKATMQGTVNTRSPNASSVNAQVTWKRHVDKRNPEMKAGQVEKHHSFMEVIQQQLHNWKAVILITVSTASSALVSHFSVSWSSSHRQHYRQVSY